ASLEVFGPRGLKHAGGLPELQEKLGHASRP
ncbi:MAG: hypothetical protein ACI82F_004279, partial [Planctomycetota bacterium]